jgi:hypothetical protein
MDLSENNVKGIEGIKRFNELVKMDLLNKSIEDDSHSMPDEDDDSDSMPDLEGDNESAQKIPKYSHDNSHSIPALKKNTESVQKIPEYFPRYIYKGVDMSGLFAYVKGGLFMNNTVDNVDGWFINIMIDKEDVFDNITTQDLEILLQQIFPNICSKFNGYGCQEGLNGKFLHKNFGRLCKSLSLSTEAILSLAYELIYRYKNDNEYKCVNVEKLEVLLKDSPDDINNWFEDNIGFGENSIDYLTTKGFKNLLDGVFPKNLHEDTVYQNGIHGLYLRTHFGDVCKLLNLTNAAVLSLACYLIHKFKSN